VSAGGGRAGGATSAHGGFDGVIVLGRVVSVQCRRVAGTYIEAGLTDARLCALSAHRGRPSAPTHPSRTSTAGRPTCPRARRPQTRATRPAWTPDVDDGLHAMRGIERTHEVERALPRVRAVRVRTRVGGVHAHEVRLRVEDVGDEGCVKRGQVLRDSRGVRRSCVAGAGALRRARADWAVADSGDKGWYVRSSSRGPRGACAGGSDLKGRVNEMTSRRGNQTPAERGSAAYSGPSMALSFPLVTLSLPHHSGNTTRACLGCCKIFSPRQSQSCHTVPRPTLSPTLQHV
jgi:hypothetical protein